VPDAVNDSPDVDAHDEYPVSVRHVDQSGAVHRHAGIVAGDVQFAECALGFRQCVNDGLLDCDVTPHRHDAFVRPRESVRGLFDASFWMSAMTTFAPASASAVA